MQHFAEKIISALAEAQCQFVIVGGLSAVLHGVPIVTQDLDVCYPRTVEMEVAGQPVDVLSLEDLIRTQRAASRPKDRAALPILEATLQRLREIGGLS